MILPIVAYGNEILHKKTESISEDFSKKELKELIKNMEETTIHASGIGLSAPQINKSISLFIAMDIKGMAMNDTDERIFKVYINPEIIEKSKYCTSSVEGCLSIPGVQVHIYRPTTIKVKFLNEEFDEQEEEISNLQSFVFQHEYDHLQGKLITDHLKKSKFRDFKNTLSEIKKGQVNVDYEMIFK